MIDSISFKDEQVWIDENANPPRTWVAGPANEGVHEYSCSENNVDRSHLGPGPGPIRKDGTRGYENPAPLPPPVPRTSR